VTSGDEPRLGGTGEDDAPMISSVQTRVIADARGAYLAGNFRALIKLLNDDQRRAFGAALVTQALWHVDRLVESGYASDRHAIAEIRSWLADLEPVSAERYANLAQFFVLDGTETHLISQLAMYAQRFISYYVVLHDEVIGARFAGTIAAAVSDLEHFHTVGSWDRADTHRASRRAVSAARRWQAEAIRALLQNRELPALEGFISEDAQGEYRSHNLPALIERMTAQQRSRFKRALLMQLASSLTARDVDADLAEGWQTLISALNAWVAAQSSAETVIISAQQVIQTIERRLWDSRLPVPTEPRPYRIMRIAQDVKKMMTDGDDLERIAEGIAITLLEQGWSGRSPNWWQIESAWAILHDDPIPPLEIAP
jgi:hypothetical protein